MFFNNNKKWTALSLSLLCGAVNPIYAQATSETSTIETASADHDEAAHTKKALDWQLLYIGDGVYGFSGPFSNQSTMMDNLLLNLTVDSEQLIHLKKNTMFFTVLGTWGGSPNNIIGSAQGIDNIEANNRTALLYQAWTEQKLLDDHLAVLVGLYDFNSEFAVTDSALIFIMPPMGAPAEIAQTGVNGPSVYPVTSLAARVKITPSDKWYIMLGAFDGVPGNPNHPYGTHVDLVKNNGLFWALENGVNLGTDNRKYKFAVGSWFYTQTTSALLDWQPSRNYGLYGMVDIPVYRVSKDSERGINVFLRPGIANTQVNMFSPAIGGGVYWKGPLAKRPDDAFGVAFSYADSTADYVLANQPTALLAENLVEATYSLEINKHLVLQSSLEWVLPQNQSSEMHAEEQSFIGIFRIKATS
jgi:porin